MSFKDRMALWLAKHLPMRLVYFCLVRAGVVASEVGEGITFESPFVVVVKEWLNCCPSSVRHDHRNRLKEKAAQ